VVYTRYTRIFHSRLWCNLNVGPYNLVPAIGRWCSVAAGTVTVGLASYWSCVTDSVVSTYGLNGLGKGDEHILSSIRSITASLPWTWKTLRGLHSPALSMAICSVMLSLNTLSCLKTVLRQFWWWLRLGLGLETESWCLGLDNFVLEFTRTSIKEGVPKTT